MSLVVVVKFLKLDQFNNPMFICSPEDEGFAELDTCYKKIKAMNFTTYLPLYQHPVKKYITITYRFNDSRLKKFSDKSIYKISTNLRTVERDGKKYINCEIASAALIEYSKPLDRGDVLQL